MALTAHMSCPLGSSTAWCVSKVPWLNWPALCSRMDTPTSFASWNRLGASPSLRSRKSVALRTFRACHPTPPRDKYSLQRSMGWNPLTRVALRTALSFSSQPRRRAILRASLMGGAPAGSFA